MPWAEVLIRQVLLGEAAALRGPRLSWGKGAAEERNCEHTEYFITARGHVIHHVLLPQGHTGIKARRCGCAHTFQRPALHALVRANPSWPGGDGVSTSLVFMWMSFS